MAALAANYTGQAVGFLGQPCNQFGGQEPGDGLEITNCVTYVRPGHGYVIPPTMAFTEKGDVNGLLATPLAKTLIKACGGKDVGWNFEAWSIGKTGIPHARYVTGSGCTDSGCPALTADIDALLHA